MLTDTKINGKGCEPKTKAFKVADSNGLYLEILPTGKKVFRYRYSKNSQGNPKQVNYTIGEYSKDKNNGVSLQKARQELYRLRDLVTQGIDPRHHREEQKKKREKEAQKGITFNEAFNDWFKYFDGTPKYRKEVLGRMNNHILPVIGNMPIHSIDKDTLNEMFLSIKNKGLTNTLQKIRSYTNQVFEDAHVIPNPMNYLKKNLFKSTPSRAKGVFKKFVI